MSEESYVSSVFRVAVIALLTFIAIKLSPEFAGFMKIASYAWLCIMAVPLGLIAIICFFWFMEFLDNAFSDFSDDGKYRNHPDIFYTELDKNKKVKK